MKTIVKENPTNRPVTGWHADATFCTSCGKTLSLCENSTPMFDKHSGKQYLVKECFNPNCVLGCENTGGHIFRHFGPFRLSSVCQRCGYYSY